MLDTRAAVLLHSPYSALTKGKRLRHRFSLVTLLRSSTLMTTSGCRCLKAGSTECMYSLHKQTRKLVKHQLKVIKCDS
jgi:hypothetical protein